MKVRFWGSRGSLPRSITAREVREKIGRALELARDYDLSGEQARDHFIQTVLPFSVWGSYDGNTSCVQIDDGGDYVLCDAGSGLRDFGNHVMEINAERRPLTFHIFMSHLHWDHIQGFPFFRPAYLPENTVNLYGCHSDLERAFVTQQGPPFFPMPLHGLQATIRFTTLVPDRAYHIAGFDIQGIEQDHPGKSYGYSFRRSGKKIVYSTDSEHKNDKKVEISPFVEFFADADLLIFDAQYSLIESDEMKRDWGHSSNILGVEFAVLAGVKHLVLFHSDPGADDNKLDKLLSDTRAYARFYAEHYPLKVSQAYCGMEVDV